MSRTDPLIRNSCLSLADIVRTVGLLDPQDDETTQRVYALLGARALPRSAPRRVNIHPPIEEPAPTGPNQPVRPESVQLPAHHTEAARPSVEGPCVRPLRLADEPALDVPPSSSAVGPAEALLSPPEPGFRLFEDTPDHASEPPRSLLHPRTARNTLRSLCSVLRSSAEVDVESLARRASRALPPPVTLPHRLLWRPARTVVVAADGSDRMSFFAGDCQALVRELRHFTNSDIVEAPWTSLNELLNPDAESGARESGLFPAHSLTAGSKLLLLSDLGFGTWARKRAWHLPTADQLLQLARSIGSRNSTVAALLPVPTTRWQRAIPAAIAGLHWSRTAQPGEALRSVHRSLESPRKQLEKASVPRQTGGSRLALGCLFCARVTPARLRALRHALFPRGTPEWEAEAWYGPHMIRSNSGYAFVNHRSLDAERHQAISWTVLVQLLRLHSPNTLRRWPVLDPAARATSGGETSPSGTPEIVPANWTEAREALELALQDDGLFELLSTGPLAGWRDEMDSLRRGEGVVIAEQARQVIQRFPFQNGLDKFEEDLLWQHYEDRLEGHSAGTRTTLAKLYSVLTDRIYADQYPSAVEWLRFRFASLPRTVLAGPEARRLAALAGQMFRLPDPVPPASEPVSGESPSPDRSRARRLRRRDVFLTQPSNGEWRLSLERPLDPNPVYRFRAPDLAPVNLTVKAADGRAAVVELNPGQPWRAVSAGPLTVTTFAGEVYTLGDAPSLEASDPQFWLTHAEAARDAADWTAVRRWAHKAAEAALVRVGPRSLVFFAAAMLEGQASAISEECVDAALDHIALAAAAHPAATRPATLRRLRAALVHMALLAIDSRLTGAIAVADAAIGSVAGTLRDCPAVDAYLIRIRAATVRLRLRRMEAIAARHAVAELAHGYGRLKARATRSRLARLACADGLSALLSYGVRTLRPRTSTAILKALESLDSPSQAEVHSFAAEAAANYASFYESAAVAISRCEEAINHAASRGRFDRIVDLYANYCRILFNTSREGQAALLAREMLAETAVRRSRYRHADILGEIAYQMRFGGGGLEFGFAAATVATTPREEERYQYLSHSINSDAWLRRAAEARGATVEAVVREFVAEARVGGEWRAELRALYELLRAIPVEADVKNSRIDPDGPEERTLELALRAGPTLDAENGFSHIAQHDSPRAVAGLKLPRPGPVDLLRSGIEIAEALQVHGSVVNDLRQIADYHLLAGQPELAVARIDDALRYAEDKKEIERWVVRARATRAEALRRLNRLADATAEAMAALALVETANARLPGNEARVVLAEIRVDLGDWVGALAWLQQVIEIALGAPVAEFPDSAMTLIVDILDGSALKRLETAIAEGKAGITAGTGSAPAPPSARTRLAWERGLKWHRQNQWRASVPQAAILLRRFFTEDGRKADEYPMPFNDYWYYGTQAVKGGAAAEAIWFYEAAIARANTEQVSPGQLKVVQDALNRLIGGAPDPQ